MAFYGHFKLKNLDLSEAICSADFNNCINLQSIILPKNLTKIEDFAFRGCKNLTSITIPSSVTAIGETNSWNSYPFYGCSNIKNVYITDIEAWCNIEFIKPISNPLANGANLYLNGELLSELVIPESVKVIKPQTFYGSGIKKVTMHEAIQSIGNSAFENCRSLLSVDIPNSVTDIGIKAFSGCSSMKSITFGTGINSISTEAFNRCTSLESVVIPNNVLNIKGGAFGHCKSLTSAIIGNRVKSISNGAFYDCSSLATVEISDSVRYIGNRAFENCSALSSIDIPNKAITIGDNAFYGCSSMTSATIGLSFIDNSYNGDNVYDPNAHSIGKEAFYECKSLTTVSIGENITSFKYYAFDFNGITKFTCYATKPPKLDYTSIVPSSGTLYVPAKCGADYKYSDWGKCFSKIKEMN